MGGGMPGQNQHDRDLLRHHAHLISIGVMAPTSCKCWTGGVGGGDDSFLRDQWWCLGSSGVPVQQGKLFKDNKNPL